MSKSRILQGLQTLMNAKTTTGVGVAIPVDSYKTIALQVATGSNANATIKFAASMSKDQPDFSQSASPTNKWDYVQINWLNNNSSIPGSTGIVVTGTDIVKIYEVNTNYIKWLCPIITAISAGSVTVEADAANDYTR